MKNGFVWQDTDGNDIQAHGGCILKHNGIYYWYGESYDYINGEATVSNNGVMCYSSKDLLSWKKEGMVLAVFTDRIWFEHNLYYKNKIQRPKVIYNENRNKFMMYFHSDNLYYTRGAVGIAECDTPNGKFNFIGSIQPHFRPSHDMTVFVDGKSQFLINSSDNNACVRISPISENGLSFCYNYSVAVDEIAGKPTREAPVVFKNDGKYYLFTSACTGWLPNESKCMVSNTLSGEWSDLGNICVGENSSTTFMSQGAFAFEYKNQTIIMLDRWNPQQLNKSGYVWLELSYKNGNPILCWQDEFIP